MRGRKLAVEHDDTAIGRPAWAFVEIALGQQSLAGAVRAHDADIELAAGHFGEGDQVAARRPHRRAIPAVAEADALYAAAVGVHDIDLLRATAVGVEDDA